VLSFISIYDCTVMGGVRESQLEGEDASGERMAMAAAREGSITRLHPAGLLTADIDWQRMI